MLGASPPAAAHESPPDLAALFPRRHVTLSPAVLAYAPFGVALAAARALLWATCYALDAPALVDADGPLAFMITTCLGVRPSRREAGPHCACKDADSCPRLRGTHHPFRHRSLRLRRSGVGCRACRPASTWR